MRALRLVVPVAAVAFVAGVAIIARPADAADPDQVIAARMTGPVQALGTMAAAGSCDKQETAGARSQTITVGGVERRYLIVVPSTVTGRTQVPVLLALHGGSDTAENARRYMGLDSTQPALYVYPQAPYWPEAGGVGWNVDPAGVDFPYFDALVKDLQARHCVDPGRVFATGKSNGAFMVNALACHRPGMLKAIAPVAGGGPSTSNCPEGPAVAAMIVHGSADQTVPIRSGEWSREYWLARNGYRTGAPSPVDPQPCVSYPGTQRPVLWCQHSGGHDWPSWTGAGVRDFFLRSLRS